MLTGLSKITAALLVPLLLLTAGCGASGGGAAAPSPAATPLPGTAAAAVPPPSTAAAATTPAAAAAQPAIPIRSVSALGLSGPGAGWAGGEGWIARTVNGGADWQVQYTGQGSVLSLNVLDSTHVWAKLDSGSLLRTVDGGAHWLRTGAAPNRGELHFLNADTGFSGNAASTDGGETWFRLPEPENLIGDVYYYDLLHGWAVTGGEGPEFSFQRTTDGGKTWNLVLTRNAVSLTGTVIRSAGVGDAWIECIGDSGMNQTAYSLFHTSDGGGHWREVLDHSTAGAGPAPGFAQDEVSGLPANSGAAPGMLVVVSGEAAYLSGYCSPCDNPNTAGRTLDGGKTWRSGEQSFPGELSAQLAMADTRNGWLATSSDEEPAVLYATDNGGREWKRVFTFLSIDMEQGTLAGQSMLPGGMQADGLIRLDWQEVQRLPEVKDSAGIPAGAVIVSSTELQEFGGIRLTFYTLPGDEDYVYTGLETARGHYSLSPAGTYNYRKPEDITAEISSPFGRPAVKITGGLGANLSMSSYYSFDEDGIPTGLLLVDNGHASEKDVDRDGSPEVVSAHGTPMTAYLYRWQNGHAEEASLNDALQADFVVFRDDFIYEASEFNASGVREYRLIPEGLIPVQPAAE